MYCYVLQGVVGIVVVAGIITGVFGTMFGLDVLDNLFVVVIVISFVPGVSTLVWILGGETLKHFMHFCVG